ncbi:MAG: esterase/lipase family protein [Xanthobacteraceae bacterium]
MTNAVSSSELRGYSRLAFDAAGGLVGLVETMHHNIARRPGWRGTPSRGPTSGITGLVYRSVRGAIGLAGGGIDAVLAQLGPLLGEANPSHGREAVVAALNGVLGDHLVATGNPLAIPMHLRHEGQPLRLDAENLAASISRPSGRVAVLVHGLALNHRHWNRKGHDHGAALARDLGYTPVYLNYNTGLHISINGRAFAELLDALLAQWPVPVEEVIIIGHSMGGLVSRSAYHYGAVAGHEWPRRLEKLVFLGTPHHGAPLERGGQWVDLALGRIPYTAAFTHLGRIRSAGITDLRHGNLLDQDWEGRDRFEHREDARQAVPLPERVQCFAIAATTGDRVGDLHDRVLGDGVVPVSSALGHHKEPHLALSFAESRQWIGTAMNHLELLDRPEVYEQIRTWLGATSGPPVPNVYRRRRPRRRNH